MGGYSCPRRGVPLGEGHLSEARLAHGGCPTKSQGLVTKVGVRGTHQPSPPDQHPVPPAALTCSGPSRGPAAKVGPRSGLHGLEGSGRQDDPGGQRRVQPFGPQRPPRSELPQGRLGGGEGPRPLKRMLGGCGRGEGAGDLDQVRAGRSFKTPWRPRRAGPGARGRCAHRCSPDTCQATQVTAPCARRGRGQAILGTLEKERLFFLFFFFLSPGPVSLKLRTTSTLIRSGEWTVVVAAVSRRGLRLRYVYPLSPTAPGRCGCPHFID